MWTPFLCLLSHEGRPQSPLAGLKYLAGALRGSRLHRRERAGIGSLLLRWYDLGSFAEPFRGASQADLNARLLGVANHASGNLAGRLLRAPRKNACAGSTGRRRATAGRAAD